MDKEGGTAVGELRVVKFLYCFPHTGSKGRFELRKHSNEDGEEDEGKWEEEGGRMKEEEGSLLRIHS